MYIYFDDLLITCKTFGILEKDTLTIYNFLKDLGMCVNEEKSIITPTTDIEWLGFRYKDQSL